MQNGLRRTAGPADADGAGHSPFVGRVRELGALAAVARSAAESTSAAVLVQGPAGIGKTALLRACATILDGFAVLGASCDETETAVRYGAVHQLVDRAYIILGRTAKPHRRAGASHVEVGTDLLGVLSRLLEAGPVAVLIDDVRWIDLGSLNALTYVVRRLDDAPLLIVATARTTPGASPVRGGDQPDADRWRRLFQIPQISKRLPLDGVSAIELSQLAEKIIGRSFPGVVLEQIHEYTGGHPLNALTLLSEYAPEAEGELRPGVPPVFFQRIVEAQLGMLGAPSRLLVEALAVLNFPCRLPLLAHVGGVANPAEGLEPLVEANLIRRQATDSSCTVEIRTSLLRDTIYALIPPVRLSALHLAASSVVDRAAAWCHRVAAATGADPALAEELEEAAATALREGDADNAVAYWRWAAELSTTRGEYERRFLTAVLHMQWYGLRDAAKGVRSSVDACAPSVLHSCVLAEFALFDGDLEAAERYFRTTIESADLIEDLRWLSARARVSLAVTFALVGDGAQAIGTARQTISSFDLDEVTLDLAKSCILRGTLYTQGPAAALAVFEQLTGKQAGWSGRNLLLPRWGAICRLLSGDLADAVRDAVSASRYGRVQASGRGDEISYTALAAAKYLLGGWADALAAIDRVTSSPLSEFVHWTDVPGRSVAATIAAGLGDFGRAEHEFLFIQDSLRDASPRDYHVFVAMAGGAIAQARNDYATMAAIFDPLFDFVTKHGLIGRALLWEPWWRPLRVEALIGAGRLGEATKSLPELRALADRVPYLRTAYGWLHGWLLAESGEPEAASERFRETLDLPDSPTAATPLHRALLEQAYGNLLHGAGNRRRAINWLRRAHGRFSELDAAPFRERCADDLARCGLRQTQQTATGLASLSKREKEVAVLAARGHTNPEVAAKLFVSQKTVEYHLGNVYAKLGISSRDQLHVRLGQEPPT